MDRFVRQVGPSFPPRANCQISADPEDASGYRPSGGGGGKRRRAGSAERAPRSIGVNLVLAVLVAGLLVAGWFLVNQHQQLRAEQALLEDSNQRIARLEDRLRVTDEAMSLTDKDTKNKIGFWEDEIRKLWAISNDRNKKWIKANEATVGRQGKTLAELKDAQATLQTSLTQQSKRLSDQQQVVQQLDGLDEQVRQVLSTQRDLGDKVNAARQSVARLEASLESRVAENEQAVAAIDAFRQQMNARLSAIERTLSPAASVSPTVPGT